MSTYDVVLLVEEPFSSEDAANVTQLHEGVEDAVRYHVLLPVEDASAYVESAVGSLGGDSLGAPVAGVDAEEVSQVNQELMTACQEGVAATVASINAAGGDASGTPVATDPINALAAKVEELGAAEVIIMTRPHVVAQLFHVDWTSRARRKLGVPVLHLLEHESFDEQAGDGEGISGF